MCLDVSDKVSALVQELEPSKAREGSTQALCSTLGLSMPILVMFRYVQLRVPKDGRLYDTLHLKELILMHTKWLTCIVLTCCRWSTSILSCSTFFLWETSVHV